MAKKKPTSKKKKETVKHILPGTRLPRFTILPDHPIAEHEDQQAVGFEARLSSVLDIIRHRKTKCPMAIALYGDWGTGKTSAMKWLERQLDAWNKLPAADREFKWGSKKGEVAPHPRVYSVWFEPWKYQKREDVWRGLIAEIILHCISVSNLDLENAGPRLRDTASRFGRFLGRSFLDALSRVKLKTTEKKGASLEVSGEIFRDVVDEFHKVNHPERAYLNDFETTLKTWVGNYLRTDERSDAKTNQDSQYSGDRMVVFIDDLDRCLPDVTLEVLEALKLYLNIPQLIFVVGLDRTVVDAVVRKHYSNFEVDEPKGTDERKTSSRNEQVLQEKSEKYLDKMFQVEINITPSISRAKEFAVDQIAKLDEATGKFWSEMLTNSDYRSAIEEVVGRLAEHNPREIKRLLNSTLMRASEAADDRRLRDNDVDSGTGKDGQQLRQLRFAQGAQVFLIQRIATREFKYFMPNPFFDPSAKVFFEEWSDYALANSALCEGPLTRQTQHEFARYRRQLERAPDQEKPSDEIEERDVSKGIPGIPKGSIKKRDDLSDDVLPEFSKKWSGTDIGRLLGSNALWRLMIIPYEHQVAESAPIEKIVSDSKRRLQLSKLPQEVQELIADAAGVEIDQLDDAPSVLEIDSLVLEDITELSELGPLEKLTALENLQLNGCTGISELGPLEKLTALKNLWLDGCTGISELGPLKRLGKECSIILPSGRQTTADKL